MKIINLLLISLLTIQLIGATTSVPPANNTCDNSEAIPLFDCAEPPCSFVNGTTIEATPSYTSSCAVNSSEISDVWFDFTTETSLPYGVTINVQKFSGSGGIGVVYLNELSSSTCQTFLQIDCAFSSTGEYGSLSLPQLTDASASSPIRHRIVVWSEGGTAGQGVFEVYVKKNFSSPIDENCSNNIDDDGDGFIDCEDMDCGKPILTQVTTVVQPTCPTNANGSISIHASGANLRYSLNNATWVTTSTFSGLSGGAYNIIIENATTGCSITEVINLTGGNCPNPTGGDNCGQAPIITVNSASTGCAVVVSADYSMATSSSPSNGTPCFNGSYHDNDIWFQFVAPTSGAVSFQHAYLPYGSYGLAVYTDCTASTYLQCEQGGVSSTFTGLTPQTNYYLRIWDNDFNQTNPQFEFCLLEVGSPVNDLCTDAIEISCGNNYTGHNINGTSSFLLENLPTGNFCEEVTFANNPGVWYKMMGTGTSITLDLCSANGLMTNYNADISVFAGDCANGLFCVKGVTGEASCFNQPTLTFNSQINELYYIYINGFADDDEGVFELSVTCEPVQIPTCVLVLGPPDNSTDTPQDMVIAWDIVDNATHYLTYIGTDGNGTSLPTNIMNGRASGNNFDTSDTLSNLDLATTYYWSVIPVNSAGTATNCPILSFTTSTTPINLCPPTIITEEVRLPQGPPVVLLAENTIQSRDIIEPVSGTSPPGFEGVIYLAGQSITLKAGFHAKAGTYFIAQIIDNPCGPPAPFMESVMERTQLEQDPFFTETKLQVFPNPFTHSTTIRYELSESSTIQIQLYDMNGRLIKTILPTTYQEARRHQIDLASNDLKTGLYYVHLVSDTEQLVQKVMVMK